MIMTESDRRPAALQALEKPEPIPMHICFIRQALPRINVFFEDYRRGSNVTDKFSEANTQALVVDAFSGKNGVNVVYLNLAADTIIHNLPYYTELIRANPQVLIIAPTDKLELAQILSPGIAERFGIIGFDTFEPGFKQLPEFLEDKLRDRQQQNKRT